MALTPVCASHNMPDKDARHFYIWFSLHGANIIKEGPRHDFVPRYVMRNATMDKEQHQEVIMRFIILCCFALFAAVLSSCKGPTQPTETYGYFLFNREGGGAKTFTVTQTTKIDSVIINVSYYNYNDTVVQFASCSADSDVDSFTALDDALHGRLAITGDFKQSTLPTGTWAFLYVGSDTQRTEITNTDLRNRLLPFEKIVENYLR